MTKKTGRGAASNANTIDKEWFSDRLRDRDLSQRQLAKLLGTDPSAVSLMLSGKRKITLEEASDLSRLLGTPMNEVLEHAGVAPSVPKSSVPLVGTLDGDLVAQPIKGAGKRIPVSMELPATAMALQCADPSGAHYGWTFFYEPRRGVDADCVGRLCIVHLVNGDKMLRVLKPGVARGTFDLATWTGGGASGVRLQAASPVLWIKI